MDHEVLNQARRRIMKVLEKKISERRSGLVYRHDFLQQLMKDDKDECPSLTDAQIQDNILTMIIAGLLGVAFLCFLNIIF